MDSEELINLITQWSRSDKDNRRAFVVLSDSVTGEYYAHYAGSGKDMARLVNVMMCENEGFGHDIFAAAMLYAKKHLPQEEIARITLVAETIAELRKNS